MTAPTLAPAVAALVADLRAERDALLVRLASAEAARDALVVAATAVTQFEYRADQPNIRPPIARLAEVLYRVAGVKP